MPTNFFKRLKSAMGVKPKFVFTSRHLANPTGNGERVARPTDNGPWIVGGSNFFSLDTAYTQSVTATNVTTGSVKDTDERKVVEPKEVFAEIKREPLEISFNNLPAKITVVKERIEILKEHLDENHLKDEHKSLFYLENRLKYLKTKKKNPIDWAMTTTEAVDDLCKRYKLQVVPLKQYYTLVPKDGLTEMSRYSKAYKAITGDEPIFELVIKETVVAPQQKKKDRDPILLANSPLGNHLFILGVWDDEVEIVDEIIYHGK